ncbi:BRO1 domain-containing protein BROX [Lingula anatina]|uniref:BRO1 domain-containing protein BROX n=1 Tax=Lingula anatina TaxID=7574 RepID=A0A1S3KBL9_LINAN|nr:BRO1 domain-containing protein BROX [Lingula anatina]|eukprot:XP_013419651.1 BRO1 domain-containing protein BROX [Lingula anatina]
MAHWFHRNPIKATAPVTFDLRGVTSTGPTRKICSDLRQHRNRLLDILSNPNENMETVDNVAKEYFSLLQGFLTAVDEKGGESKLRHIIRFRWTNTLTGNTPTAQYDAMYEFVSMAVNVALWYTKHAAKIAAENDEPSMDEAKEVHTCLRKAAGIFVHLRDKCIAGLIESPEQGTDLDSRVVTAYMHQSTAEAQEVTLARAVELKHTASLISALAFETSNMFQSADDSLKGEDERLVTKWRKYLQLKRAFYMAYAYSYHGETLLAQDKCGEAIRCLRESVKEYEKAGALAKEYKQAKGPGTTARPEEHLFFRRLGPIVKRTLEKCERENGFIYHHKVPEELPDLALKATYGLASPEEVEFPPPSPAWNPAVYAEFKVENNPPVPEKEKEKGEGKEIPPVKEEDIKHAGKDPRNNSGCVVS